MTTNRGLFLHRIVELLRPKPRSIPLSVDEILGSSAGRPLVDQFNDLYYVAGAAGNLSWRGVEIIKNPCDLWMMVELFQRLRPVVLIETGTHLGGAALFYADITRTLGIDCQVITIDYKPKWGAIDPVANGVTSLVGYSTDAGILRQVRELIAARPKGHVLVTLDAGHTEEVVAGELELYSPLVTLGSYLIAEDTNLNGHPSFADFGPGPWEAVEKFLSRRKDFVVDPECERFLLTFNPRGWLKRIA